MDSLRVDFTGVEAAKYEPLPPGWYPAKVTNVETRVSEGDKTAGETYLNWEFTVQTDTGSKKFWNNTFFNEKSLPYTLAFLEATDKFEEPITSLEVQDIIEKCLGCDIQAKLRVKDDQNQVSSWRSANAAVGGQESLLPS